MLAESNNVIASNNTLIIPQGLRSGVFDGNIDRDNDVDLYRVRLNAGEGITLDIDGDEFDSDFDSILRLFDESGNELAINDDRPAPGELFSLDSYLTFIADISGNYYVGISSIEDTDYDLFEAKANKEDYLKDDSAKNYELEINIVEVVAEADTDDTIFEAIATGLGVLGDSNTFADEIEVGRDIDIYQLQLNAGDGLNIDIDAAEVDSNLDSQLRLFDDDGNELASSDDNPAPEEVFSTDSYIGYRVEAEGKYYVGVSSAENADYDAINGRTNLFPNNSTNSGSYNLNIDVVAIESDSDPDNTIAEANNIEQNYLTIFDSIDPQGDVDVFKLNIEAQQTLTINLDAAKLNTGLDTALLLFDESGNEIARSDDNPAPGEDFSTIDSYLEFTADTPETYYVAISGFPNLDYDIVNGRDNLGFNKEIFSIGNYELVINSLDNLVGTDDGDVLNGNSSSTLIRGLQGDDLVTGGENSDYLWGNSGNDILSGNNGNDTLIGGTGNDSLSGGNGRDILQGDNGNNKLRGGTEADIFVLDETSLENTIVDFEVGIDKILLLNNTNFVDLKIEDFTSEIAVTLLTTEGNAIAQILGVSKSDLSEADFITNSNGSIIE